MLFKLHRGPSWETGTFGILSRGDYPLCVTCEDPWRDNQHYISCIPEGTYTFRKRLSPKHSHHWEIVNVPGRDLVLIHAGNTIDDTQGCILVGRGIGHIGNLPSIVQSQDTMQILREELPDEGTLEIINPK